MVCGGFGCSRHSLIILNVIYIIVSFVIIGVAAYGRVAAVITSLTLVGSLIACGVILFLIALVGLLGAAKHHQVLLFFYMIILFLLFLLQFALACACLAVNSEQKDSLARQGWQMASPVTKSDVQSQFDCCGFEEQNLNISFPLGHPPCGSEVWRVGTTNRHGESLFDNCPHPFTFYPLIFVDITSTSVVPYGMDDVDVTSTLTNCCTKQPQAPCCNGAYVNATDTDCPCQKCFDKLRPIIYNAFSATGGVGLFFSFTEILGVWLTVRYRNQKDPSANPSAYL